MISLLQNISLMSVCLKIEGKLFDNQYAFDVFSIFSIFTFQYSIIYFNVTSLVEAYTRSQSIKKRKIFEWLFFIIVAWRMPRGYSFENKFVTDRNLSLLLMLFDNPNFFPIKNWNLSHKIEFMGTFKVSGALWSDLWTIDRCPLQHYLSRPEGRRLSV